MYINVKLNVLTMSTSSGLYPPLDLRNANKKKNLYPTPLFLFRKHRDNTTLDCQLTRGSVLLVTAHARDVGRESPFALR
jgi:hypothetical protein